MKPIKYISLCIAVFSALSVFVPWSEAVQKRSVVRLHVMADADDALSQSIKLSVRDAVLEEAALITAGAKTPSEAEAALMRGGSRLLCAAETALREARAPYGAQLMAGRFTFPQRDYSGKVYPAGEYTALRVVLGSGHGKNWWCVMFPPLCIVELSDGEIDTEELSEPEFRSLIAEALKRLDGGRLWKRITEKE